MEWSAQPDFMYSHQWQEGDLVIWNNSGVLHRVIPYDSEFGPHDASHLARGRGSDRLRLKIWTI